MAIALVQSTQAAVTGASPTTVVFGSNNTAGNFLVICGRGTVGAGFNALTVTDSAGNSWTVLQSTQPNTASDTFLAYVPNCLAGANTVRVHSGGPDTSAFTAASFIIAEYSGVVTTSPVDQHPAVASGTGQTTQAGTPVTTTGTADLVIFFGTNETLGPLTPVTLGGGFTLVQDSTHNAFMGHILNAPASTYSPTFTAGGGSSTWNAFTSAFFSPTAGGSSITRWVNRERRFINKR